MSELAEAITIPPAVVRAVGSTLLHFLWQGLAVAAALALVLSLLRASSARLRYAVSCCALALMAALPLATVTLLLTPAEASIASETARAPATTLLTSQPVSLASSSATPTTTDFSHLFPWLTGFWLAGVAALSLTHLRGWQSVRRLRTEGARPCSTSWQEIGEELAQRLGIQRTIELLESSRVTVPSVIGCLKPVVLIPTSTFTGLSPSQLESILAHELAHIRRHDYVVNVFQIVIETLLFYHPAVWWVSGQIRDLREHCCDDVAVEICGDRLSYARALAELEDLRFATPAFALGADGGSLLTRIRRLANKNDLTQSSSWLTSTIVTGLVILTVVIALLGRPGFAQQTEGGYEIEISAREIAVTAPLVVPPIMIAQTDPEDSGSAPVPRADTGPSPDPQAASTRPIPIDTLIELKIHGADQLLEALDGTAYEDLPLSELIEMAKFGINRGTIAALEEVGLENLSSQEMIKLAKFGVDGHRLRALKSRGYDVSNVAELIEMAKFGINETLIDDLAAEGFEHLPPGELVSLAKFGINGPYIREIREAGLHDASANDLVQLSKFGVDGALIAELAEHGFDNLAVAELVKLAKFGIHGQRLRGMVAAGYQITDLQELVDLAKFGVDERFIRSLTDAGYQGLTSDQMISLAKHGVDGDFILELREAGLDKLTIDELTKLARHGIDADMITRWRSREHQ